MTKPCRSWWRNCALEADAEIQDIDRMEDSLAPIDTNVLKIRELISSLELCHHKADRWVYNIIEAISTGKTHKGLGTRSTGQEHPAEKVWQNACAALSLWCSGNSSDKVDLSIDNIPASQLLATLGDRSPLKEWQVQRVIEKIRNVIYWQQSLEDPKAPYTPILLSEGEYESCYRSDCPDHYKKHEDFWLKTVRTFIYDTENGKEAELSLGLAIDMLWPCHWAFVTNLQIVLDAIGGKLNPETPFTACGRNINLVPVRNHMEIASHTLNVFSGTQELKKEIDKDILDLLGEPTEVKKWLAASLAKTIQLQLNPSAKLREMCALAGPDWIKQ